MFKQSACVRRSTKQVSMPLIRLRISLYLASLFVLAALVLFFALQNVQPKEDPVWPATAYTGTGIQLSAFQL